MTEQGASRARSRSISDREIFKLSGILLPDHTDVFHSCLGRTPMAPLDDLIHLFPIALKDRLDTAIPAVFNRPIYPRPKSHILSMLAKEDSLNPPFNDDPCPYLSHIDLAGMCPASPPPLGWGRGVQYRRKLPHREAPPIRACSFTIITGFV